MNFKDKILPWLKAQWLMLVLGIIAITALPTAWYFSSQMNTDIRESFQKQLDTDYKSVTGAKNAYYIPNVAGEKTLEVSTELNQGMTTWYADRWNEVKSKTGVVWDDGLKFNKSDHALLIKEGMFPQTAALEHDVKTRDLIRAVMEFHKHILAEARAGMPPDPAQLGAQLNEAKAAGEARILAEKGTAPDQADKDKLSKDLLEQRVGAYRRRAGEIGVYADLSIFTGVPIAVPNEAPSISVAWDYQERCWLNHDIMRAVAKANSDSSVPGSIVKRVNRIGVGPASYDPTAPQPIALEAGEDKAPLDFSRSVTGRISGPGSKNKWYDVRGVVLDAVVSSQRLPALVDALAATNFISVLDVEIQSIDPHAELASGFYYGDEHVVRVIMQLETVWLRDWRKDWMPEDVKKALGMSDGVVADPNAAASSAPPSRRTAPPPPPAGGGRRGGARED